MPQSVFAQNESIAITLIAKNITNSEIRIWIDGGNYPTGTELKLTDSVGKSMVRQHWSYMSSQFYSIEQADKMKTKILPNQDFKKEFMVLNILQLNRKLTKGKYELDVTEMLNQLNLK